jgi:hypothetical protein
MDQGGNKMLSTKLSKVNESITINRYDNAWMVEVSGSDKNADWIVTKTVCNTESDLVALIKEWNGIEKTN